MVRYEPEAGGCSVDGSYLALSGNLGRANPRGEFASENNHCKFPNIQSYTVNRCIYFLHEGGFFPSPCL